MQGQTTPVDLNNIIGAYTTGAYLTDVEKIICIGAASQEGNRNNEERLAGDRIESLVNAFPVNNTNKLVIRGFNFGQYVGNQNIPCSTNTIEQRRIVILKITKQNIPDTALESSLKRVLIQKAVDPTISFPIDIRNYSMFQANKTMLVSGRN